MDTRIRGWLVSLYVSGMAAMNIIYTMGVLLFSQRMEQILFSWRCRGILRKLIDRVLHPLIAVVSFPSSANRKVYEPRHVRREWCTLGELQ